MTLLNAHITLTLRYTWLDQQCENIMGYVCQGVIFGTTNPVAVAEAWWNDVKTDIRALAYTGTPGVRFVSVICRNRVDGGELGEFAIPTGEQSGTRSSSGVGELLPSFTAGGIRLTVSNTTTRPGQKRFPFLGNVDVNNNALASGYYTLLDTVGAHLASPIALGIPVAGGALQPEVGGTEVGGFPTVYQWVVGHVTNPNATSQVSRKLGRGR